MLRNEISRRAVLASGVSLLGTAGHGFYSNVLASSGNGFGLSEVQRGALIEALENADRKYDPAERMITSSVSGVGYHTTLKSGIVHPTRTSLSYATALLDSGEEPRLKRAKDILHRVISLQDQNPDRKTYGIWSWYLEEPLDKMSPPDWNWADFCGAQLLAVWIDHRERLGEALAGKVRESILHAAQSIKRRNVGPGYTNIAIMGTYVTLVTGERLKNAELLDYGRVRLRKVHRYIMDQGSFTEYNSSTYSIVAIAELSRMLAHVKNEDDRTLVNEIHDLAWKHVATHFHPPTRQWAGPNSRCYNTDLRGRKSTLAFLEMATGRKGILSNDDPLPLGLGHYRLPIHCPERYHHYFVELNEPRIVVETFRKSSSKKEPKSPPDVIGTTCLHPKYTLGTVNVGDFWNQRRPFVAYWGTPERPAYLQVRFLHDGYDYSSAIPFTCQHEGTALCAVVFATDYGDTHVSLDKVKNATIQAKDFRLRFEFGAEIGDLKIETLLDRVNGITIEDRDVMMCLKLVGDQFGEYRFQWETGRDEKKVWIDAVAYCGEERAINFVDLKQAYLGFAFEIASKETGLRGFHSTGLMIEKEIAAFRLNQSYPQKNDRTADFSKFELRVPAQPGKLKILRSHFFSSHFTAGG